MEDKYQHLFKRKTHIQPKTSGRIIYGGETGKNTFRISFNLKNEAGHSEAMEGLSYNFNTDLNRMQKVSLSLSKREGEDAGSHKKFLRQMMLWVSIDAPRYWWSEFDTYQHIVKNSQSTMHTGMKHPLYMGDFECPVHPTVLKSLEACRKDKSILNFKQHLPESFMQKRMVTMNYASLRTIISQRRDHKLPHWQAFTHFIMSTVNHPEYLEDLVKE